jgi:prepilin-type N-terminal cleavage/methylation domain-containing protein
MKTQGSGPRSGFTLIELIMGIFVLSVSLLGMLGLVATSFGMSRSAHEITQAKNGAMRKIEEIRELSRTNYSQILPLYTEPSTARHFDVGNLSAPPTDPSGKPGLVTVTPSALGANLLDVVVNIHWQGCGGPHNFELRSRVSGN